MPRKKLPRKFFDRPAKEVAKDLLGKILCVKAGSKIFKARIVETEAYVGEHDQASHARFGKTDRNAVMYGPAGYAYIYFIYGMYEMLNVVTHGPDEPQAVLIRAAEPVDPKNFNLSGPGRLTRSLKIDRRLNGADLCGDKIFFLDGKVPLKIFVGPRIGVDYAGAWAKRRLRFLDAESPFVSVRPKLK